MSDGRRDMMGRGKEFVPPMIVSQDGKPVCVVGPLETSNVEGVNIVSSRDTRDRDLAKTMHHAKDS